MRGPLVLGLLWCIWHLAYAGGHLDHLERDPGAGLALQLCHVAVLLVLACFAARALRRG